MAETNRRADPLRPESLDEATFFDIEMQECPHHLYRKLREEAPVWQDPKTGFWVLTRYEDLRKILLDTDTYGSQRNKEDEQVNRERAERVEKIQRERGWVPAPSLALRDNPNHAQMRALFDNVFRESRLKALDPEVEALAHRLIDGFIDRGGCEFVKAFAVPLPLIVIGRQMGVPEEDIWKIKGWTESWVSRTGLMLLDEDAYMKSVEVEIEAQHYFQKMFDRLRRQPDNTLLSDLVNKVIPEWGRPLSDEELHAEMMADTFVGGSETTTSALAAGIVLVTENPDIWPKLKSGGEQYLRTFIEEVLRLESPVQSRVRIARRDIELHGVKIPRGAMIDVRFGAANRDQRHFECPEKLDLERRNAAAHLSFGSGTHHCMGAPLARRELYWSFKALFERIDAFRLAPGKNNFRHVPNFWLHGLRELHIEFTPAAGGRRGQT